MDKFSDIAVTSHFNLSFPGLPCRYSTVNVFDGFGERSMNVTADITKTIIDRDSLQALETHVKGKHFESGQCKPPEPEKKPDCEKDLHGKMEHSTDGEIHDIDAGDITKLLDQQQYILMLYYFPRSVGVGRLNYPRPFDAGYKFRASTISPSKPTANQDLELLKRVSVQLKEDREKEALKADIYVAAINCQKNKDFCHQRNFRGEEKGKKFEIDGLFVWSTPTYRLFSKQQDAKNIVTFQRADYYGIRNPSTIVRWVDKNINDEIDVVNDMSHGCQISGSLQVPKTLGSVEFTALSKMHNLRGRNINMTHVINHLSFGRENEGRPTIGDQRLMLTPLDNKMYVSQSPRESPHHYLHAVPTAWSYTDVFGREHEKTGYQINAQHRVTHTHFYSLPNVRLMFNFSPTQVSYNLIGKSVYEYMKSLLAVIGGVFAVHMLLNELTGIVVENLKGE